MAIGIDFSKLRTSWTKYDAVQVMEVIYSIDILNKFKNKEANIDEPILRSFLGIKSLKDDLPEYWFKIQNYPDEKKKLFALFSALFMHGEIINAFADKYSKGDMKGVFIVESGKQYTNIRSALIESGAAQPIHRRTDNVPYDFSTIFQNTDIGKLFKQVLVERISRLTKIELTDSNFYEVCFSNNFHKAISLTEDQFKLWLEGANISENLELSFIEKVKITNFLCVEDAQLDFKTAKEIYFLGENGDGKSLILMGIYLAFNGNYVTEKTDQERTGKVVDIIRNNKSMQLSGFDDNGNEYNIRKGIYLNNLFGYGTHRGRYSTDKPEEYGFMSLFDSEQTLLNPVSWLKDQKLLELEASLNAKNAIEKTNKTENTFPVESLVDMFYNLLEKHVEIKVEGNEVFFREKGSILTFDQLSEGYKSILIFVCDLIYRLNKTA
ncbi:MAG: AAA family ATPase, partial [Nitrososphaeraceae archaeon]